jgi:hypothetical protein
MTTPEPAKTVDPGEATIWAALGPETPVEQVTYDETDTPSPRLSNQQPSPVIDEDGSSSSGRIQRRHSVEQIEVSKRKHRWLIVGCVVMVVASVTLGSLLGLNAKKSNATTSSTKAPTSRAATSPETEPSPAPSEQPTFLSMDEFMGGLPAYSLKAAQTNASSPQAKALAWLQNDSDYELYRLNQRYVLGVLYYSTNMQTLSSSQAWLSNASECAWYNYSYTEICDESFRLSVLSVFESDFGDIRGSIPRELELLSDLKILDFDPGSWSGSIYPELYVP